MSTLKDLKKENDALKEDYNSLVDILEDPLKYREVFLEDQNKDIFDIYKKDFIEYLKKRGELPTSKTLKSGVPTLSGSMVESLRRSTHRSVRQFNEE